MKTLALLCLSLAVALGLPVFTEDDRSPLLGAWVPVLEHVVEDPAPQIRLGSKEQGESAGIPEVKAEPEAKEEPEVKAEPEVKEEQEVKAEPEVKEEQEVEAEPEVKEEQEVKAEPEVKEEQEVKAEPEVKEEQEVEAEPEVKEEQEVKAEPEVKEEQEVMAEPEVKEEQEVMAEPEVKEEQEVEAEPEVKEEKETEETLDVNMNPDVMVGPEGQLEPEDFQVANEVPEDQQTEAVPYQEVEERHIDMERNYKVPEEPIMETLEQDFQAPEEPSDEELSQQEQNWMSAFLGQELIGEEPIMELEPEPLPEAEGLMGTQDLMTGEEPIMELEPLEQNFQAPEEPSDEELSQEEQTLRSAFLGQEQELKGEEPNMEPEPEMSQDVPDAGMTEEGKVSPEDLLEPGAYYVSTEEEPEEGDQEADQHVMDVEPRGSLGRATENSGPRLHLKGQMKGGRSSIAVVFEGRFYQYFTQPRTASEAEFFCQRRFPGGHLASITTQEVHRQLMNLMLLTNEAYTRAWVGGLRYLNTGRFIWLDGSQWHYEDWLSGEPNHTANLEDCLEVLPHGKGKFNDFTCWEPQAFFCSYPFTS
ncbi:uncharacterized protein LOC143008643 [Genypterus blacodes]|uniref:uncharacterized protein LOC143008643 n=1 Tax=Genypterus blacodes TaxID=154954 RepID=UPI003F770F36